ncbi:phiSA1p31-related protein [Streptomyces sp. NPDC002561]|uniref:phiSA1p31-related protein n=1 Tax=Streptomyces sp. NPDC002561 TaxID=3154418 RepID=UPI003317D34C
MAHAQYETRTRTVEETVVVLTLTEDEAKELRDVVREDGSTRAMARIYRALMKPEAPEPEPEPSADTFEHDGVTYDLNAKYRDTDGDVWRFARFGNEVIGGCIHKPENIDDGCSLAFVMDYGPLTKVTA